MFTVRFVHELRMAARRRGPGAVGGALRDGGRRGGGAAPRVGAAGAAPAAARAALHRAAGHGPHLHAHGVGHTAAVAAPGRARVRAPLPRQPVTTTSPEHYANTLFFNLLQCDSYVKLHRYHYTELSTVFSNKEYHVIKIVYS